MAYTPATKFPPTMKFFQWSQPLAPKPVLNAPLTATATTIVWSQPPRDHTGTIITGDFLVGIKRADGYVESVYIPAGQVSVDGLTATNVIRGVRLEGLDYTTGDATKAVSHLLNESVFCNITGVIQAVMQGVLNGTLATGGSGLIIGTDADGTVTISRSTAVSGVSAPWIRWNTTGDIVQYSDDGTNWFRPGMSLVSAVDTTPGYLNGKLVAGAGISLTPSGAGNETLAITNTGGAGAVNSVNSGTDINVDNTDPANPIVNVDAAALAADNTFVNDLALNPQFVTNIQNIAGGGGGSNNNAPNSDPTSTDWATIILPAPFNDPGAGGTPWMNVTPVPTVRGGGSTLYQNATVTADLGTNKLANSFIGENSTVAFFDTTHQFIAKYSSRYALSTGVAEYTAIGFFDGNAMDNAAGDITSVAQSRVVITSYNGAFYGVTCTGGAVSSVNLGVYTVTEKVHTFGIAINGVATAKFYVDGVLAGTLAANIPASGSVNFGLCGAAAAVNVGAGILSDIAITQSTVASPSTGGISTAGALVKNVAQVAHGFSVGDVLKSSGVANEFALAQADSAVNAEVVGIVTVVPDADHFTYAKDYMGYTGAGIPAGTAGEAIFLSASVAGAMTITEPTGAGEVSKPIGVLIATAATMNFTADYRGQNVQSVAAGSFIPPQYLCYSASTSYQPCSITTLPTNSNVVFVAYRSNVSATVVFKLERYELNNEGIYIKTHSISSTHTADTDNETGIVALGNYVYASYANVPGVTHYITRYDAADLTNEADCTVIGGDITLTSQNAGCFTDGTNLYFYDNIVANGNRNKYSVAGLNLTFVSSIDFGSNQLGAYCDGTNVYLQDTNNTIQKRDLTGALVSTADSIGTANNPFISNTGAVRGGLTYSTSNALMNWSPTIVYTDATVLQNALYGLPVDKF